MLPVIASLATTFLSKAADIIKEKVEDKDKANEIIAALQERLILSADKELEERAKIILAEAQGESWLQRNWRPILMLTIVAIIANNYVIVPWLSLFTGKVAVLKLPDSFWNLLGLGVGGYIAGRSGEKIIKTWKSRT